jgi:hypothetical protein
MTVKTIVCIASGPSLTEYDCKTVEEKGLFTIAVNNSWKMARFCNVIFAGDPGWWKSYKDEIDIPADLYTINSSTAQTYKIKAHPNNCVSVLNSGMRAIQLAISMGAKRVILLGYDCSVENGTHWHGDHKETKNPDEKRVRQWIAHFSIVANESKDVEIINCSRDTKLPYFKRMQLAEALCL